MIFATTGTHEQPMDRLAEWLDAWAVEHGERVVVQAMATEFTPRAIERVPCVAPARWRELVQEARVVVSHAGPSSIFEIQALGKTPVVVPRSASLGEHVDEHQQRYAATLGPHVPTVSTREQLWMYLRTPPPLREPQDVSSLQRAACTVARECILGLVESTPPRGLASVLRGWFWR